MLVGYGTNDVNRWSEGLPSEHILLPRPLERRKMSLFKKACFDIDVDIEKQHLSCKRASLNFA